MSDVEDFASYPVSISEKKSGNDASSWTPRDALISVLREIDNGQLDLQAVVICLQTKEGHVAYRQATPTAVQSLGILERTKFKMMME